MPLSKSMGAVSEVKFKVIKEVNDNEVDRLPLVLKQLWQKIKVKRQALWHVWSKATLESKLVRVDTFGH